MDIGLRCTHCDLEVEWASSAATGGRMGWRTAQEVRGLKRFSCVGSLPHQVDSPVSLERDDIEAWLQS